MYFYIDALNIIIFTVLVFFGLGQSTVQVPVTSDRHSQLREKGSTIGGAIYTKTPGKDLLFNPF